MSRPAGGLECERSQRARYPQNRVIPLPFEATQDAPPTRSEHHRALGREVAQARVGAGYGLSVAHSPHDVLALRISRQLEGGHAEDCGRLDQSSAKEVGLCLPVVHHRRNANAVSRLAVGARRHRGYVEARNGARVFQRTTPRAHAMQCTEVGGQAELTAPLLGQ